MLILPVLLACSGKPAPPPTVVVISIDTTRADAIGAYAAELPWHPELPDSQRPRPFTPTIDRLAERGTRFSWALSHAPTTLSSHTSMMAGVDPHEHRVVRNGYPVPDDLPLLAEQLRSRGWDTIAVVGAAALERRMGLDRGFRVYEDHRDAAGAGDYMVAGSRVTETALQAVATHPAGDPLFLFVHYYDPHMLWVSAPPELRRAFLDPAYAGTVTGSLADIGRLTRAALSHRLDMADVRQARGLYLAEVAYVDREIGRLLGGLSDQGLLDDSLVVVLSDHGETHDEADRGRPWSHGPDVDLVDIHVPMVWAGTGRFGPDGDHPVPAGLVVDRQVRVMDLAPTVLGFLGMPPIGHAEDLGPLFRGARPPAPPSFAEATQPVDAERTDAWNNLSMERAVALDGTLLVRTPLLSDVDMLYALDAEQSVVKDPARASRLRALLDSWDAAAPPHRDVTMAPETVEGLKALGYIEE